MNPMLSKIPSNNPIQMMQRFAEFKKQMAGQNPEAMVNELIRSGKMTQQQFEELRNQAQGLMSLFGNL